MSTLDTSHRTVSDLPGFLNHWGDGINFALARDFVPCRFNFPAMPQIVDAMLANDHSIAITGTVHDKLEVDNIIGRFRAMKLDDLMKTSFQLTHFNLREFDVPGGILEGFHESVVHPWRRLLLDAGFTWDRLYAVMRVSGPDTVTGYHMDSSHVLFWNVRGRKLFHGLKNPGHYAPASFFVDPKNHHATRPASLLAQDVLTYEVGGDSFLWNQILTPHWVDAPEFSFGINLSHGGLRYKGALCRNEQAYYDHRGANPNERWIAETGSHLQ